ncbi:MAG: HD domain-containing protein [Patescibacteria group bacterium]|nr:HD domain-containing protein [Patescibacteria group bacterium]
MKFANQLIDKPYCVDDILNLVSKADNKRFSKIKVLYNRIIVCDYNIAKHCYHTALLAREFLNYLIENEVCLIEQEQIDKLIAATILHDIGKTNLEVLRIINNGKRLTDKERLKVQKHSLLGYQILKENALDEIAFIVLHHHELWDGSGYPDKLSGDSIPLLCRFLTICDSFAAMMDRSRAIYNGGIKTWDTAFEDMKNRRGVWYDPDILDYFLDFIQEKRLDFENFFD